MKRLQKVPGQLSPTYSPFVLWKHFILQFRMIISLGLQAYKTSSDKLFVFSLKYSLLPLTSILLLEAWTSMEVLV